MENRIDKAMSASSRSPSLLVSRSPCLLFCIAGLAAAAALGWVGAMLSLNKTAPVGLVPLGIGLALGLVLIGLAEVARTKERRLMLIGAVAFAIFTVFAQHAWLYQAYRQQWKKDRIERPAVALFRSETSPLSLTAYFQREVSFSPGQTALWALDAALILVATVTIITLNNRRNE
jgi:hypothetical protein